MEETTKYLNYNEILEVKRILIQILTNVTEKTELGYYYSFSKIVNLINQRLKQIKIIPENLFHLMEIQEHTLVLDSSFQKKTYTDMMFSNVLSSEFLMIRSKQIGLNLLAKDTLDSSLKNALSLYFSSSNGMKMKQFYERSCDTSLPFFDLTLNVISQLKLIVSDDLMAYTLCYGDQKLSDYLSKISGKKATLKQITSHLFRIQTIQNKMNKTNMNYIQFENLYYKVLAKLNTFKKQLFTDSLSIPLEQFYEQLDENTKNKLQNILRLYDLYQEDNSKQTSCFTCFELLEKLQKISCFLKDKNQQILHMLDREYIETSDFIIHHLLLKYLKDHSLSSEQEVAKCFDYKITNQYSYLEHSKEFKKLKRKMNS